MNTHTLALCCALLPMVGTLVGLLAMLLLLPRMWRALEAPQEADYGSPDAWAHDLDASLVETSPAPALPVAVLLSRVDARRAVRAAMVPRRMTSTLVAMRW